MEKRNISVAKVNGYTLEKVKKAKEYLDEIGKNRRTFPMNRLVEMYNDIFNKNETAVGCRPCQSSRFYNNIQNFYQFGKLTLINNAVATESDFDTTVEETVEEIENKANRVQGVFEDDEEAKPQATVEQATPKRGRPKKTTTE